LEEKNFVKNPENLMARTLGFLSGISKFYFEAIRNDHCIKTLFESSPRILPVEGYWGGKENCGFPVPLLRTHDFQPAFC
jgi:hypothetical protein